MDEELKPCPFCGGAPGYMKGPAGNDRWMVACAKCGCRQYSQEGQALASQVWNQRAEAAPATVPEGWKPVPIEPTESMVIAGFESVPSPNPTFTPMAVWDEYEKMSGCQQAAFRAKLCWAAMLAAAPAQVDESAHTHRKTPDEIGNLHKQVAAQETWKILPSQSGETRYACPSCLGEPAKPSAAFFNTGEDWTKHYQAEVVVQCQVCCGGGLVTAAVSQRYFIGHAHRQDRMHRGENMRDAAQRLGVTVPQLSAWELGYSDLATGEPKQEPVSPFKGSTD